MEGAFAVIARKGAKEAGAIFVVVNGLDATHDVYAPAPQTFLMEEENGDRLFTRILSGASSDDVSRHLDSEARFDSDLWVVEIEDRERRSFISVVDET